MNATLKGDFWKVEKAPQWLFPKLMGLPRGQEELINAVKKVIKENMAGFEEKANNTMSDEKGPNKVIIKYYGVEVELGRIENNASWHKF